LVLAALLLLLDWIFPPPLPDVSAGAATIVLARDGRPLRAFADARGVWRYPIEVDAVSPRYIEALLTYEDRWFWQHPGVNPLAVLRAAGQAVGAGRTVSGASTLTMQVARLIEPQPPGMLGKLRQSLRALQLEWRLDKAEILQLYLNYAPFGGPIQGVEAAAWAYLGKSAAQLSQAEAALLAVLPQSPSRLRPDRHPERARAARDKVLQRLQDFEVWSAADVTAARQENVIARSLAIPQSAALLAERLRQAYPQQRSIRSSIDAELQQRLEAQLGAWVERLPPRTSAALLLVDNASLEARVYIGSARFGGAERFGHLDMVQAWRSPGSTLKPLLYGLALDAGLIHSGSLLVDAPQDFDGYRPENFDDRFRGPVSATSALQQSLNVPAVALLQALGSARFAARLQHGGLPLRMPAGARPNLSMILGGTEVRLEDLVAGFSALQRQGRSARLRLRSEDPLDERALLSPGAAWIVSEMLSTAPRPGEAEGRYARAGGSSMAFKTGTSYGFRDSWALGATPAVTLGVWIGRPDGTPLPGQFGAVTALPLLLAIADSLPAEYRRAAAPRPASVTAFTACWPLGTDVQASDESLCHRRLPAFALDGSVPLSFAPAGEAQAPHVLSLRVDARSGLQRSGDCRAAAEQTISLALWPRLASPWLSADERRRGSPPALSPDCRSNAVPAADLQIIGAREGSRIRRPSGSRTPPRLQLRAAGASGEVSWLLNGRLLGRLPAQQALQHEFDSAGPQDIVAIDGSARYGRLQIEVLPAGSE
jgi:penicillin-binding protein 1C